MLHVRLKNPDVKVLVPIVIGAWILLAGPVTSTISVEEIATKSGLVFHSNSSPTTNKNQPETMVAGIGLFDYDNDGYLDAYFGMLAPSCRRDSM